MAFVRGECSRDKNAHWKGGRIRKNGYIFVLRRDHPRAHNGKYVHEHVCVMEDHLCRLLAWHGKEDPRSEVVHHVNGDRTDNRIENLVVVTYGEHTRMHNAERRARKRRAA